MKTQWWQVGCAAVLFAFGTRGLAAQDNRGYERQDQNRDNHGQDNRGGDHHDGDHHDGDSRDHDRFDDHDRQVTHDWYEQHRNQRGFRDRDRLSQDYEPRFENGAVLDRDMRRRMYPAPYDLVRRLPPAPRGYRYVVIGGHIVMVDNGYHVQDAIHLELNFH